MAFELLWGRFQSKGPNEPKGTKLALFGDDKWVASDRKVYLSVAEIALCQESR
jgi:hypothetical protein